VKRIGNKWKILNPNGTAFTQVDYDRLFESQQGKCALCGRSSTDFKRSLCSDHDHKTGTIRSLLCPGCNTKLSGFENTEFFQKALNYLKTYNA
jgi:hypothetical protein